ncbi:hypothetical protein STIUS_v1c02560 [Spiroplasma sp. TIUS-1]|uniref:hypothetical protein n=1 Tax=Spiroplasma sp. TIUS-1 TaxID=216963 RepID=UPI0013981909|nr:hypothetical protein [Spiroplasma sp. TIUS-1]QHX35810.1 hypothetical protein STIUS_v1c02560 [Spiroplasma sp. TIUS-1]
MAKKKYRMRTPKEVQEPIINYVDPRSKSLQSLDEEPKDKIIHSLAISDLEKANGRFRSRTKKKSLTEVTDIYFSTGKDGFARLLITACQLTIIGSYMLLLISLSFLIPVVKDLFLELLPVNDEIFLLLFVPIAVLITTIFIVHIAFTIVIILLPILVAHKIKTLIKWSKISWYFSVFFGLATLLAVILIKQVLQSISWSYEHWNIELKLSKIQFNNYVITIGVALAISTLLGYPLLISSTKKQHNKNIKIQQYNLRR